MSALLDTLLDAERRAECARHDAHQAAELARLTRGEPYRWPQVDRNTHPANGKRVRVERRGPRASRSPRSEVTPRDLTAARGLHPAKHVRSPIRRAYR